MPKSAREAYENEAKIAALFIEKGLDPRTRWDFTDPEIALMLDGLKLVHQNDNR